MRTYMECCTVRLVMAAITALDWINLTLHFDISKLYMSVLSLKAPLLILLMEVLVINMAEIWLAPKASGSTSSILLSCMLISANDEKKADRGTVGITT